MTFPAAEEEPYTAKTVFGQFVYDFSHTITNEIYWTSGIGWEEVRQDLRIRYMLQEALEQVDPNHYTVDGEEKLFGWEVFSMLYDVEFEEEQANGDVITVFGYDVLNNPTNALDLKQEEYGRIITFYFGSEHHDTGLLFRISEDALVSYYHSLNYEDAEARRRRRRRLRSRG